MGTIGANYGQYQQYKYAARAAESMGKAQKTAADKQAANLEEEARSDASLTGRNLMRMRQNQNAATASVRAARGTSGFTDEGSASQSEIAIADALESTIDDMALSGILTDQSKRYAADVSRFQGNLATLQAGSIASQYRSLGSDALGSSLLQAALTIAGGAAGAAGLSAGGTLGTQATTGGMSGAMSGAYNAYNIGNTLTSSVPGSLSTRSETGEQSLAILLNSLFGKQQPQSPYSL